MVKKKLLQFILAIASATLCWQFAHRKSAKKTTSCTWFTQARVDDDDQDHWKQEQCTAKERKLTRGMAKDSMEAREEVPGSCVPLFFVTRFWFFFFFFFWSTSAMLFLSFSLSVKLLLQWYLVIKLHFHSANRKERQDRVWWCCLKIQKKKY